MTIISRMVAFIVVSIGLAFLLHHFDSQALAEIYSTPPDAYIQSELEGHQHGFFFDFILTLLLGAAYLGAVEIVAYGVRRVMPKEAD